MQKLKARFNSPDGSTYGSLQSCVRTNDLDLIGDGSHLTSFVMVGNFSFGGPSYEHSADLWTAILDDLGLRDGSVIHVHPSRPDHRRLWESRGFAVVDDSECVWTDGNIGGHCCEVYYGGLEIGNLVNTLEHSTDVGFGLERVLQILEGKSRVDDTSLFNQQDHPIVRDHLRTLQLMRDCGVVPGNKGRGSICKRLLRRTMLHTDGTGTAVRDWIEVERASHCKRMDTGKRAWKKHKDKSPEWWMDTFGIMPEELYLLV